MRGHLYPDNVRSVPQRWTCRPAGFCNLLKSIQAGVNFTAEELPGRSRPIIDLHGLWKPRVSSWK